MNQPQPRPRPPSLPTHRWTWPARIVRVVDADTIDAELDAGFRAVRSERLRLLGVNAPEVVGKDRARGLAATAYVKDWIDAYSEGGGRWPFIVETHIETDSFGRYLAVLWARLTGACLNDDLIAAGHATEFRG